MTTISEQQSRGIIDFVRSGAYPEGREDTFASSLEPGAIASARRSLREAQQNAEEKIRSISREVASDVDGWIEQAKKLQADIEHSRVLAREIVEEAENAKQLQAKRSDAAKKAQLLEVETRFQDGLEKILRKIKISRDLLADAREAAAEGHTYKAFSTLQRLEEGLPTLGTLGKPAALDLLHQRVEAVREDISVQARVLMSKGIAADRKGGVFSVKATVLSSAGESVRLSEVIELAASLGLLDSEIARMKKDLDSVIISPILGRTTLLGYGMLVESTDTDLTVSPSKGSTTTYNLFQNLLEVMVFVRESIPQPANRLLAESLMPSITAYLLSQKLPAALPLSLEGISSMSDILDSIKTYLERLHSVTESGAADLLEWIENLPKVWLGRKREKSVDIVRSSLAKALQVRRVAEHVETQVVSAEDAIAQVNQTEDWDEDWGGDAEQKEQSARAENKEPLEEEDWGAWDADEPVDGGHVKASSKSPRLNGTSDPKAQKNTEEEEGDDWGWDEQKPASAPPTPRRLPKPNPQSNSHVTPPKQTEQVVTLRETYTVTDLPDELSKYISKLVDDAQKLHEEPYSTSPIAPAANALYSLPTISVSAYRALAPSYYELLPGGNMLLYNDSMRLATQLKSLQSTLPTTSRLKLDSDITTLESFARRSYSKAMDEQRTILRDFIDNAQGFANCTTAPYKQECDNAVQMTVAHTRSIAEQWSTILSRSAWLQSLGSLVSTIIAKVIIDIEEMGDIGADESTQLKTYCTDLSKLGDMFVQDDARVAGVYVREWFKFQYLAEILESNLEDMKFLWREGGLAEEFERDEVVELVKALFAEGDRRRRAIAEIRRT